MSLAATFRDVWDEQLRLRRLRVAAQRRAEVYRMRVLVNLQCQRGLPHPSDWMPAYRDYTGHWHPFD